MSIFDRIKSALFGNEGKTPTAETTKVPEAPKVSPRPSVDVSSTPYYVELNSVSPGIDVQNTTKAQKGPEQDDNIYATVPDATQRRVVKLSGMDNNTSSTDPAYVEPNALGLEDDVDHHTVNHNVSRTDPDGYATTTGASGSSNLSKTSQPAQSNEPPAVGPRQAAPGAALESAVKVAELDANIAKATEALNEDKSALAAGAATLAKAKGTMNLVGVKRGDIAESNAPQFPPEVAEAATQAASKAAQSGMKPASDTRGQRSPSPSPSPTVKLGPEQSSSRA